MGAIYKVILVLFAVVIAIVESSGAQGEVSLENEGVVSLGNPGIYVLKVNNSTVAKVELGGLLYHYQVIKVNNITLVFMYNATSLRPRLLNLSIKALAEGSNNYVVSVEVSVNHSCPRVARSWLRDPSGPPLPLKLIPTGSSCILSVRTGSFPLGPSSWAVYRFQWHREELLICFGPIAQSSNILKEGSTTTGIERVTSNVVKSVASLRNNKTLGERLSSGAGNVLMPVALGLSLLALALSVVYEVGGSRKS